VKTLLVWILGIALLAVSPAARAQNEDSGGGGGVPSFGSEEFDGSQFGDQGGGGRGGRGNVPARSPVDVIRDVLAKAGLPLTLEQQKTLQAIVDAQQVAQQAAAQQAAQQAAQNSSGGTSGPSAQAGAPVGRGSGAGGGGRGSGPGLGPNRGPNRGPSRGDALQEKLVAALTPEQQTAWKKYQRDQIIARGGYPALRLALEEAGSPPTSEQEAQLQAQFRTYDQQQRELRAATGAGIPDAAKMKELETAHLALLIKLLDPAQRKALLDWRRSTQSQNPPR
jgi:hypothetical protein